MRQEFFSQTRTALEGYLAAQGASRVHAKTLYRVAYKGLNPTPWTDPSLSKSLAAMMSAGFEADGPKLTLAERSGYDRSVKFLVELADGQKVEAVLMPEKHRITLCISSQVGCAQGCVFCHTGRMGLLRNLTAGEIVGQVVQANRWIASNPEWIKAASLPARQKVSNIVFMGMGEPLDNVEAVIDAVNILTDAVGFGLGLARISVSTAGHLDGINRLLEAIPKARIALSVHCTDDSKRSRIMPINRRWPIATVIARLRELAGRGASIMLQYTMIEGVNDSLEEAQRLVAMAAGLDAKVNLIPLNEVSASRLQAPTPERIQAFRDVLYKAGLRVMIRYSKGQDIAAACGQLIVKDESGRNSSSPVPL